MRRSAIFISILLVFEFLSLCLAEPGVVSPREFLGYSIGKELTPWNGVLGYFRELDSRSDLVEVNRYGESTGGREMIVVTFFDGNAEENLEMIRALKEPISDEKAVEIAEEASPVLFLNCDIHSSEYEDSESVMQFAYELVTEYKELLDDVMVVINPSINPDGHDIYREWYQKYEGTEYASTRPPNYHAYVDHDLNRDWHEGNTLEIRKFWNVFLNYSPQIFIDNHMMGSYGYRMYIAPESDPINPEINPIIRMEKHMLAGYIMGEFERNNCPGIVFEEEFDLFFPGYGSSWPSLQNSLGCTWEIATGRGPFEPLNISRDDLRGGVGVRSGHQPTPWEGGVWDFEDQIRYRLVGWRSLLNVTALMGEELLYNYYVIHDQEMRINGAYALPFEQRDAYVLNKTVNKLIDQGIEVRANETAFIVPKRYPLTRTLLGEQRLETPYFYDVTAWNYGIAKNVVVCEVDRVPDSEIVQRAELSIAKISGSGNCYLFNHTLSAMRAVNDLLDGGREVYMLNEKVIVKNVCFPEGTFVVKKLLIPWDTI